MPVFSSELRAPVRTRISRGVLAVLVVVTAAGCAQPAAPPAPVIVTVPTPAQAPAITLAAPTPAAQPSSWVMPDLVGAILQDAQNTIQSLTDFGIPVTRSHDATGAGRGQVLDRNWRVCDQNIAPGATITASTSIDFGAVKLDERC